MQISSLKITVFFYSAYWLREPVRLYANDGKVISIVLVRAVTCGLWSWRDWVWYLLSPIFLTLFYKALLWQGGIWYWLFLGLFKKFE